MVVAVTALVVAADAPLVWVYLLAVIATAFMTIFRPVHSALVPLLCTDTAELTSANVVRGAVEAVAALVGPVTAGVLFAVADPAVVFVVVAALAAAACVPLLPIATTPPTSATTRSPGSGASTHSAAFAEMAEGLRAVGGHPDLRLLFGLGLAQTVVRGALNVFFVVVAFDLLDTGDSGVATLAAAMGVGGLVGAAGAALLVGSRHLGVWLAIALALWGAPIAAMAGVQRAVFAFTMIAIVGIANAVIDVPLFTLPVRLVDDAVLARAFGVFEALISLGVGVGSVVAPVLIALVGLRPAMAMVGLLLPLLALVCWPRLRALDDRLGVRDVEIGVLQRAPLLALLPVPVIEHLASRLRRRSYPAGSVIVHEGDTGDSVFVVISGSADVLAEGRPVATIGAGDVFGEVAVLHDVPRTATVIAETEIAACELERVDFLTAMGRHQPTSDAAYALVAQRLANYRPGMFGP